MKANSTDQPKTSGSQSPGARKTALPYPRGALAKDKTRYCVTVFKKNKEELFAFWRDFSNLATFMKDVESVRVLSPKLSQWKIKLENNLTAEWTAEITHEVPGEEISWKSTAESEVQTSGSVWFRPATNDLCTVVGMNMNYKIPGGKLTEIITKFTGEDPKSLSKINLKRFKALMETGEVPTIEGQSSGREGDNK